MVKNCLYNIYKGTHFLFFWWYAIESRENKIWIFEAGPSFVSGKTIIFWAFFFYPSIILSAQKLQVHACLLEPTRTKIVCLNCLTLFSLVVKSMISAIIIKLAAALLFKFLLLSHLIKIFNLLLNEPVIIFFLHCQEGLQKLC